jgi:hypothetical protein
VLAVLKTDMRRWKKKEISAKQGEQEK